MRHAQLSHHHAKVFREHHRILEPEHRARFARCDITVREFFDGVTVAKGGTATAKLDDQITTALQILTQPAGRFVWEGRGFGALNINTSPGGDRDVMWGPIPQAVSIEATGNLSASIEWNVQLALAVAADADPTSLGERIMEYCYSLSFDVDKNGRTTRTHQGFLRIPLTRSSPYGRTIPLSVDSYRSAVVPTRLIGFERTQKFAVDESKQKLTFTVVDVQRYGNPLPPGIIDCQVSQDWDSAKAGGVLWMTTISAKYTLLVGVAADTAVRAFVGLVAQRVSPITTIPGKAVALVPGAIRVERWERAARITMRRCTVTMPTATRM